jgi:hypothetical protein
MASHNQKVLGHRFFRFEEPRLIGIGTYRSNCLTLSTGPHYPRRICRHLPHDSGMRTFRLIRPLVAFEERAGRAFTIPLGSSVEKDSLIPNMGVTSICWSDKTIRS